MSTIRTSIAVLVTAYGAVGPASPAGAQANCDMYGKLALQQHQENLASKCGFSGPGWSADLKAHIAWCSTVAPDQWKSELQKRQQQLDACKAGQ